MSKSEYDIEQFKIGQRNSWDTVASGWQKWWKTLENGALDVSKKLVELAEIKSGQNVLDIATGIGEPAITAAKVVGNKGHVLATDISPQMLSIGIERARLEGLQNIDFKESDAERLDLPNSTFDSVLCRWGLMFLPDLPTALTKIYNSLISGGKLSAAVWAQPKKVPFIDLPMNVVRQSLNLPDSPQGIPGPFSLSDIDSLKNSLLSVGFVDVHSENIKVIFEFDSPQDYVNFVQEIAAPVNMMLAKETDERKNEIWNSIKEEVIRKHLENQTGHVKFDNESICVVGCKK